MQILDDGRKKVRLAASDGSVPQFLGYMPSCRHTCTQSHWLRDLVKEYLIAIFVKSSNHFLFWLELKHGLMKRLDHPNIAKLYDAIETKG